MKRGKRSELCSIVKVKGQTEETKIVKDILEELGSFGNTEAKGVAHSFSVSAISLMYLLGMGKRSGIVGWEDDTDLSGKNTQAEPEKKKYYLARQR